MKKKPIDLDEERLRRGKPIERWRRGIYAVLVVRPKAGLVRAFRKKQPSKDGHDPSDND
jgi:hypothetical protein